MHQDFKTCAYFTLAKLRKEATRHTELLNHLCNMATSGFTTPDMELLRIQTLNTEDFKEDANKLANFYKSLANVCKFDSAKNMDGYMLAITEILDKNLHEVVQQDLVVVEAYITYQNSYATINKCNTTMRNMAPNCISISIVRPLQLLKKFLEYYLMRHGKSMKEGEFLRAVENYKKVNSNNTITTASPQSTNVPKILEMCHTIEEVHNLIITNIREKCSQSHWDGAIRVWQPPKQMQLLQNIISVGEGTA